MGFLAASKRSTARIARTARHDSLPLLAYVYVQAGRIDGFPVAKDPLFRRVNYIVQWATPNSPVRFERGRDAGNPPRVVPEKIGEILNSSYAEYLRSW